MIRVYQISDRMNAYLVLQFRSGDMVTMHKMFNTRRAAFQYLEDTTDSSTSWWKILEFSSPDISVGQSYEVSIRVRWETSNRVTFVGVYPPDQVPADQLRDDMIFVERMDFIQ